MFFPRTLSFTLVALLACLPKATQANADVKSQAPDTKIMICPLPEFDDIAIGTPSVVGNTIHISSLQTSIEQDQIAKFNGSVLLS